MSTTPTRPESIEVWDIEEKYLHRELDLDYIDGLALDLAALLVQGDVAEAAYQPGDGTFYGLVFVPLQDLKAGRPRIYEGREWETHAVRGMKDRGGSDRSRDGRDFYEATGFLVCWVDHSAYPLRLSGERGDLAAGYIHEHWLRGQSAESAVSLTVLFRAISYHLGILQ